jgi:hypothetical protein
VQLGETVTLTATVTPTGNVGTLSYGWDVDGNGTVDQTTATNTTTTSYATVGAKAPKVTVTSSVRPDRVRECRGDRQRGDVGGRVE